MTVRSFIAVEISDAVKSQLAVAQTGLKELDAEVKWVPVGSLHLTLVFLGDLVEETVVKMAAAMDPIAAGVAPFECRVTDLGYFGRERTPRVLWAGLAGELAPLQDLATRLADAARLLGLTVDSRPAVPHVTLGRVKSSRGVVDLLAALEKWKGHEFGKVAVGRVLLMKSQLTPDGPLYTTLHTANLSVQI